MRKAASRSSSRAVRSGDDAPGARIDEYIGLPPEEREGKVPFIHEVRNGKLLRYEVAGPIVELVEERRRHWRILRSLAGQDLVEPGQAGEFMASNPPHRNSQGQPAPCRSLPDFRRDG